MKRGCRRDAGCWLMLLEFATVPGMLFFIFPFSSSVSFVLRLSLFVSFSGCCGYGGERSKMEFFIYLFLEGREGLGSAVWVIVGRGEVVD